ncbi:lysine N(6)-hydroxylase/L-ornithine N(5)-oxygenase family protein [Haloprofundus halobius]|uniref:lysine N(6)-hydroxylase/L-ornithine N(5)-oxygenase family protein n=1 Tax=Haloprofundus halobius TaxID=2876194 RepID=UPI001CCC8F8E|nr:lysine N(6)-hydroxylase/L-ornithine N(5)-oxygenase family protein [Haloprofundus halobius]
MTERIYDLVGIGLGPFNLGLAALLDELDTEGGIDVCFLEQDAEMSWHEGMLIEGTTLEVPFLADLVTLADPTNPNSYLNYLRETGRIYEFYFYETFQIPRQEYDDYLRWVAERLDSTRFSRRVTNVRWNATEEAFHIVAVDPETDEEFAYLADDVVLGVGSRPHVPEHLQSQHTDDVFHTSRYRSRRERCLNADSITVVGSGQSAAEVFLDLLERQPENDYRLDWLTRSEGFFPMEYSKLGLQHFSPEYTQYFYDLPQTKKDEIRADQDLLYKGIDPDTSAEIYDALYRHSIGDRDPDVGLFAMTEVEDIEHIGDVHCLQCRQWQTDQQFVHNAEVVVLGTGYHRPVPSFLSPLGDHIEFDCEGRFRITEDYRLETDYPGRIFVQNADLHTHGVGAPDLGLGCFRNARIVNQLVGGEVLPEDTNAIYQDFAVEEFVERTPGAHREANTPNPSED